MQAERVPIPEIAPEKARELALEGQALRIEYHRRVQKMWVITLDERQAKTCRACNLNVTSL
jgi:hypothetical protein